MEGEPGDFETGVVMLAFHAGTGIAVVEILVEGLTGWAAFGTLALFSGVGVLGGFAMTRDYWTGSPVEEAWNDGP